MKFYSEELKKFFDTAEDCQGAEDQAKAEREAAAARKAKLKEEKTNRKKEVENAINKANELVAAYIKDYGSYSISVENPFWNFVEPILNSKIFN